MSDLSNLPWAFQDWVCGRCESGGSVVELNDHTLTCEQCGLVFDDKGRPIRDGDDDDE